MRTSRRFGSPKDDPIGFIGTTLGRAINNEARQAQERLNSVATDMSLNEANEWLNSNYPNLKFVRVVRLSLVQGDPDEKFPNSQKRVVVGG